MSEEAAPDYRALLDALGYPPIMGGAEGDEPPTPQDTPPPDPGKTGDSEPPKDGPPADEPPSGDSPAPDDLKAQLEHANKRIEDLHGLATQAQQEAAQHRQIVELARQGDPEALQYLGYEVPADTEGDKTEPTEQERLDRIEQALTAQQEGQQRADQEAQVQEAADRFYEDEFSKLDPESKWTEDYKQQVAALGDHMLADDNLPDLEAAHKALQSQFEEFFKQRVASKRSPQAPSGVSATQDEDLDNPETRQEWMLQQALDAASAAADA